MSARRRACLVLTKIEAAQTGPDLALSLHEGGLFAENGNCFIKEQTLSDHRAGY